MLQTIVKSLYIDSPKLKKNLRAYTSETYFLPISTVFFFLVSIFFFS